MKSVSTFLRQQLKIKGKTSHNGRGAWEMRSEVDITYTEVLRRINGKIEDWKNKGLVESFEQETNERGVSTTVVTFNEDIFNPYYRKFIISDQMGSWGTMGIVGFSIPNDREQALRTLGVEV